MKELISRQVVLAEVKAWFDDRDMDGSHLLAVLEQIPVNGTIPETEYEITKERSKKRAIGRIVAEYRMMRDSENGGWA